MTEDSKGHSGEVKIEGESFGDTNLDNIKDEELSGILTLNEEGTETKKPPEFPYIKFNVKQLLNILKIFAPVTRNLIDIFSRACLFKIDTEGRLEAIMSDGTFKGKVYIPYETVTEDFYSLFVVDYDSLVKIVTYCSGSVYLIKDEETMYVDFLGGKVHLPRFVLDHKIIENRMVFTDNTPSEECIAIPSSELLQSVLIARDYLGCCQIPDMQYMFIQPDYVLLSTGFTAMKMNISLGFTCTLRKQDLDYLIMACQMSQDKDIVFDVDMDHGRFRFQTGELIIPFIDKKFPAQYESYLEVFDFKNYYYVEVNRLYLLLSVLSKVYRTLGVVNLKIDNKRAVLESESQDGKKSAIILSQNKTGNFIDTQINFSTEVILSVLKSVRGFDFLNITVHKHMLCLYNDSIYLTVIGAESGVKAEALRVRKQVTEKEIDN